MGRPRIKDLNKFVQLYHSILLDEPHSVKWKKMEDRGGVDYYSDTIYLNPTIPLKSEWTHIINKKYVPSVKLRLREGEQYFFTLLHEIAHFKLHYNPLSVPKEWVDIYVKLLKSTPNPTPSFRLRKPPKDINDVLWLCTRAMTHLKQKENEKDQDYVERYGSLASWLCGDWDKEHIEAEEWAIKEFRKQRKRINKILEGL